ncbi:nucleoside hydrolase [Leucogyrophana mollusca]|uniref:Nucleoside hydrolase n=1 Tax=Leucogyrophana mollusca TaxID=85980 RepID=A0ACB8BLB0_9AGAM|nr:nucleoside hydrolase [Leucogyrophana mollusca]
MEGRAKIPVIIDTDPGVDDVIAILLALASPELEILAIIVTFGHTDALVSRSTNIYKVYQAISRHLELHPEDEARFPNFAPTFRPILAVGPSGPLEGGLHYAQYFHGKDGLGNIMERHPDLNVTTGDPAFDRNFVTTQKSGVEVALELIQARPERSVTYVALGPLTNLAQLMRDHGQVVRDRIGRVISMGGAVDVPGNTSPVAEFNFFADPFAVKELLMPAEPGLGLPLERFILLPLDITTPHELSFKYYTQKVDSQFNCSANPSQARGKAPLCHFTSSFLERTREIMNEFGKDAMELHDIVAIWCAIENPPEGPGKTTDLPKMAHGWAVTGRTFDIEREGEITRGMLVVDRRDDGKTYVLGANRAEVQAELDQHAMAYQGFEPTAVPAQVMIERPTTPKDPSDISYPRPSSAVPCVVTTPGPDVLLQTLMERVWGIN